MADKPGLDELARRFGSIVGFGEDRPPPKCPVHRVTLSSVFGCTLCDGETRGGSTNATAEEQDCYIRVFEHQVLEEYELQELQGVNNVIINTETACFGFIHPEGVDDGKFEAPAQKPFRGHAIWLFGDKGAALTSLQLAADEQMTGPLPFEAVAHRSSILTPAMLAFALEEPARQNTRMLVNARCRRELSTTAAVHLTLPSINVGQIVAFSFTGRAYAVLLVGQQIP
jgi:hypothetical protein